MAVDVVRESLETHATRYLQRVYTDAEVRDCQTPDGLAPHRLAARFAAKEATIKVLRPESEAIAWPTIEVVRHPSGSVEVELSGRAATLAAEAGLGNFALSISHEAGFATAVVVAEESPFRNAPARPIIKP